MMAAVQEYNPESVSRAMGKLRSMLAFKREHGKNDILDSAIARSGVKFPGTSLALMATGAIAAPAALVRELAKVRGD